MMTLQEEIAALLEKRGIANAADLQTSRQDRPLDFIKLTFLLDDARGEGNPEVIETPFRSIVVAASSDTNTYVEMAPHDKGRSAYQNAFKLDIGTRVGSKNIISRAYLTWPAQAGKTITLYLSLDSEFTLGKQYSVNAGGISVNEGSASSSSALGSAGTDPSVPVLATATIIFPVNTSRIKGEVYFDGPVWIGDSGIVFGSRGVYWPGGLYEWKNTSALYAIAAAAGVVTAYGNSQS